MLLHEKNEGPNDRSVSVEDSTVKQKTRKISCRKKSFAKKSSVEKICFEKNLWLKKSFKTNPFTTFKGYELVRVYFSLAAENSHEFRYFSLKTRISRTH